MLLPVGSQTKAETRAVAHRLGLEVIAEKEESQDICFVPDGDHTKIIRQRLGDDAPSLSDGPFVLSDGTRVGRARRLRALHDRPASRTSRRIPRADVRRRHSPERSRGRHRSARRAARPRRDRALDELARRRAGGRRAGRTFRCAIAQRRRAAEIVRLDGDEIELALDEPVSAITPGQSLVMYDGERVLGGGLIERASGSGLPVRAVYSTCGRVAFALALG